MSDRRGGGLRGDLKQRVKTGRGRTVSSKLWLERQLNDPYVARAKREGYRSRAAFKLMEIDDRFRLLKRASEVVDLGAAPAAGRRSPPPRSAAIPAPRCRGPGGRHRPSRDRAMPGVDFVTLDFLDPTAPGLLTEMLGGTCRRRDVRHGRQRHRSQRRRPPAHHGAGRDGAGVCPRDPAPGGTYLAKVLQGGTRAVAHRPEARFRERAPRQAGGEPGGFERALRLATGYRGAEATDGPYRETDDGAEEDEAGWRP